MKHLKASAALIAAAAILSACGGNNGAQQTAGTSAQVTAVEQTTAAAASSAEENKPEETTAEEKKLSASETYTCGDYEYTLSEALDNTVMITKYNGSDSILEIPAELDGYRVDMLEIGSFKNCDFLKEVSFAEGITELRIRSFVGCHSLEKVTFPASLTRCVLINAFKEENYAFTNSLKTVVFNSVPRMEQWSDLKFDEVIFNCDIPDDSNICVNAQKYILSEGVENIGSKAFNISGAIKPEFVLPKSLKKIPEKAFIVDCITVTIPDTVEEVSEDAFRGKDLNITFKGREYSKNNLDMLVRAVSGVGFNVVEPAAEELEYHYDAALEGVVITGYKGTEEAIRFPTELDGDPVKSIKLDRTELKCIEIPEGVTSIFGSNESYSSIEQITLPESLEIIGDAAFTSVSCPEIVIPGHVTEIRNLAFSNSKIESIVIPDSVTNIGAWAFTDCSNLKSVTLPAGNVTIGAEAFSFCKSLTEITIPEGYKEVPCFLSCTNLKTVNLPESLETIATGTFYNCESLESITIPSNVKSIDGFYCCKSLKEINLPDGLESIGMSAFKGCYLLRKLDVPDSVTKIYSGAFDDNKGITVTYKGKEYNYTNMSDLYNLF